MADDAQAMARHIVARFAERQGRGLEGWDATTAEIADALRAARYGGLADALAAAWSIGGRYNWQAMRATSERATLLNRAHAAWEAAEAVRRLVESERPLPTVPAALPHPEPPPRRDRWWRRLTGR